jgi:spore germination protein YaaH
MTYDEHYPGSESIGPVASLPFVYKGITDMLEQENVPKEQLLMGLPFYNRIWITQMNNDTPENREVRHFGMERTVTLLTENGVTPEWDAFVGGFYGQYAAVEDGVTVMYHIWLEDEHSIAEKLNIFKEFDLAGVAGWRRGFENEKTQRLLKETIEKR